MKTLFTFIACLALAVTATAQFKNPRITGNAVITNSPSFYAAATNLTLESRGSFRLYTPGIAAGSVESGFVLRLNDDANGQSEFVPIQVETVAALKALPASSVPDGWTVRTSGYYTLSDEGQGTYIYSASSTATPDNGAVILPTFLPGRFLLEVEQVNPRQFGAKGDGSTDDTVSMQAFVDYVGSRIVYTNPSTFPCYIPDGVYLLSSVTNNNGVPIISSSGAQPGEFGAFRGVVFMHKAGSTAPMWVVQIPAAANRSSAIFQGITFWGRASQTIRNPKAIVSSSTRTNLVVAVGNLPTDPFAAGLTNDFTKVGNLVTGINWPYFGWARLGTSDGAFLGHALIQSINYGTGAIVIQPDRDNYESRTNTAPLLGSGDTISFASIATEDSGYADDTGIEAGSSGWAAIHITSPNNQTGSGVTIRNCWIRNFHTGVRIGNVLTTKIDNCRFDVMEFASVAAAFPGDNRDGRMTDIFLYGGYSQNPYTTSTTNVITAAGSGRNSYQNQTFGIYGFEASGIYRGIVFNNTVYGGFGNLLSETQFDDLLVEATIGSGLLFQRSSAFWITAHFDSLIFRTYSGTPSTAATNRVRNGIEAIPNTVNSNLRVGISKIGFPDFASAGLNKWTTGLSMRSTDTVNVGLVTDSQGVTTVDNATGAINYAVLRTTAGAVSGLTSLATAAATVTNSITVGTTSSGTVATFTGGTGGASIAQLVRSGQPTIGLRASAGLLVYDETSAKSLGRFSWSGSSPELVIGSPATASPVLAVIQGEKASGTDAGGAQLYVQSGQGTGSGSTASSLISLRTPAVGASGTGLQTMTERIRVDSTQDVTLLPMWINHNGTVKQVQVGAADSGGVGFRMVRIAN